MDHRTKVHTLAHMLAHGHGEAAPIVALKRARECREGRDYVSALTWLEVALLVGRDDGGRDIGGRDIAEDGDAGMSDGACHDGLVTLLRRRRHHKP